MATQKATARYRSRSFKLPIELADRIDAATEKLTKSAKGARVTCTSVVLMLLERGLDVVEKELKPKRS